MVKAVLILAVPIFFLVSCTAREKVSVIEPDEPEVPVEAPEEERPEEAAPEEMEAPADTVRVISETLNVRSGPNINYEVLGRLGKGDTVVVMGSRYGWKEVELPPGYKGWVHSDYVELPSEFIPGERVQGTVDASRLNVRALPGLTYNIITQVERGDTVAVVDRDGDWLGIEISGLATGWVHSDHIDTGRRQQE